MRFQLPFAVVPVLLLVAHPSSAEVSLTFPGLAQQTIGSADHPDATGAAGPAHFAEFVNGGFAVYDKTGSLRTAPIPDKQFWISAGAPEALVTPGVLHPRIAYDPHSGRWFAAEVTRPNQDNHMLLAVTTGADPSPGNWRSVSFPAPPPGATAIRFGDYPTLGLDANGVYLATVNRLSKVGADRQSNSLYSIPKVDLTSSSGPSLARMTRFDGDRGNQKTQGFVLQPVVNWFPLNGDAQVLAIDFVDPERLDRTRVIGSSGSGAALSTTESIPVRMAWPPTRVRQPDGTGEATFDGLDTSDDRFATTVYQVNNLVYAARQTGQPVPAEGQPPDRTGVRWSVLRIDGPAAPRVVAEGTISERGYDLFQPSIAANAAGDLVLVFNRSGEGADGAINAFYATGTTSPDGSVTFGPPKQITESSVTDYHNAQDVWGLYSSLTPDPSDPKAFWAVQEVPASSSTWGTQITRITVPEPAAAAVCSVSACLLLSRRRREP
jgi:hypothetical protein